jgi:tetratricopeptide (TPR) repeat protein
MFIAVTALMQAGCSSLPSLPAIPGWGLSDNSATGAGAPADAEIDKPLSANATPREHINRAVLLLGAGRTEEAREYLDLALAKSPSDKAALDLIEQIDADPFTLLGREHRTYVVVAGDTMSELAQRHLGDPLKFYALSRYNGLSSPNALREGATLRIPTADAARLARVASATTQNSNLPTDAAKANTLRRHGLEALNKGEIDTAVDLLGEARTLNAADPAIQRDLERALRIQASLVDG